MTKKIGSIDHQYNHAFWDNMSTRHWADILELDEQHDASFRSMTDEEFASLFPEETLGIVLDKTRDHTGNIDRLRTKIRESMSIIDGGTLTEESRMIRREAVKHSLVAELLKEEASLKRFAAFAGPIRPANRVTRKDIEAARAVQISALINDRPFRRSGSRLVCRCPFQDENTPSFTIFSDNRAHCFGCKFTGDPIAYVQKSQGLSFKEAVMVLKGQS